MGRLMATRDTPNDRTERRQQLLRRWVAPLTQLPSGISSGWMEARSTGGRIPGKTSIFGSVNPHRCRMTFSGWRARSLLANRREGTA